MVKLTEKQRRFIEEYLIDLDGRNAAIRAGYAPKAAEVQASRLLRLVKVRSAVDQAIAERSKRTGVNQDKIIRELAKIAFLNPTDVINMDEATIKGEASRDDTAAIASVKVKTIPTEDGEIVEREVKTYDKVKALDLLGKHQGMFKEKIELDGVVIKVVLPSSFKEE